MVAVAELESIPGKRSQEYVTYPDGERVRRCYGLHNPHWYFHEGDREHPRPIEIDHVESAIAGVGDIYKRAKNMVSVGFRQDGKKEKYLGLRPDVNQHLGTEQLEWSLEHIEFDGKKQEIDLSQDRILSPIATDFGSLVLYSTRRETRQLVKVNQPINNFQIQFKLHLQGLRVEHRQDIDEYWIYSEDTGEFRFRIRKPILVDNDFAPIRQSSWSEIEFEPDCSGCKDRGICCVAFPQFPIDKDSPCKYLNEDGLCSIYDIRPDACRNYPHWSQQKLPECTAAHPFDGKGKHLVAHSLEQVASGEYIYRKTSTPLFTAASPFLPNSFYVDADTYYSTTADGTMRIKLCYDPWADCRGAATADQMDDTGVAYSAAISTVLDGGKAPNFTIDHSFFYFDTSGATAPSAVDLLIYGYINAPTDVAAMKGTQGTPLAVEDFDSFTGSEYGHVAWAIGQYNTISFNAQGISDIDTGGTTLVCAREYDHDYLDVEETGTSENGCYFAEETGTTKDPKLEITENGGGANYDVDLTITSTLAATAQSAAAAVSNAVLAADLDVGLQGLVSASDALTLDLFTNLAFKGIQVSTSVINLAQILTVTWSAIKDVPGNLVLDVDLGASMQANATALSDITLTEILTLNTLGTAQALADVALAEVLVLSTLSLAQMLADVTLAGSFDIDIEGILIVEVDFSLAHNLATSYEGLAGALDSVVLSSNLDITSESVADAAGSVTLAEIISINALSQAQTIDTLTLSQTMSINMDNLLELLADFELVHSLTVVHEAQAAFIVSVTLPLAVGLPFMGLANTLGDVSLTDGFGLGLLGQADALGSASLSTNLTTLFSPTLNYSVEFVLSQGLLINAIGIADAIAMLELASGLTIQSKGLADILTDVALDIQYVLAFTGQKAISVALTLSETLLLELQSNIGRLVNLTLSQTLSVALIGNALVNADILLDKVTSLFFVGDVTVALIDTPDERMVTVSAETRILEISHEDRTITVSSEVRVIEVTDSINEGGI